MTEFVILSRDEVLALCEDKPVTMYIDKKPYVLCTDEYFEKEICKSWAAKRGKRVLDNIMIWTPPAEPYNAESGEEDEQGD